jgi:hypothetical protein
MPKALAAPGMISAFSEPTQPEPELGEGERGQRVEEKHQRRGRDRHHGGVRHRLEERHVLQHMPDVVVELIPEGELGREPVDVGCAVRRHDQRPREREHEQHEREDQYDV